MFTVDMVEELGGNKVKQEKLNEEMDGHLLEPGRSVRDARPSVGQK